MSVIHFRKKMFPLMEEYVLVYHHIIQTGLKDITSNIPLNQYYDPFFLQYMNGIQVTKPSGTQCNRLLDAVVTILKYRKRKIVRDIYINVFSDGKVSYLTVSNDYFITTNNNETVLKQDLSSST